jgi:hypothetical protein
MANDPAQVHWCSRRRPEFIARSGPQAAGGKAEGRQFDPAPDHKLTSNLWACDQAKRFRLLNLLSAPSDRSCPSATTACCPLGHAEGTTHDPLDANYRRAR